MSRLCRNCGAELPEGAAFCPHCETAQVEKHAAGRPRLWRRKALAAGLALLGLLAALGGARALRNVPPFYEPRTYDQGAECLYEADGVTYHLLLTFGSEGWIPRAEAERSEIRTGASETLSQLCVYREEGRETCREEFLALVKSCMAEIVPGEDARAMDCGTVEEDHSSPYAILGTEIGYRPGDGENDIRWTLTMRNGDTIRMSHRFTAGERPVLVYRPEDTPLETAEELQALLDEIAETVDDGLTDVRIYLPAVTYDRPIIMERGCSLLGSGEGEARTTFTQGIRVRAGSFRLLFRDLRFADVPGTALYSDHAMSLERCEFLRCGTAALGLENGWIGASGCTFEDNQLGLVLACRSGDYPSCEYLSNRFTGNGVAFRVQRIPEGNWRLVLEGSVFQGNGVDIDNIAGCRLDTSRAEFLGSTAGGKEEDP